VRDAAIEEMIERVSNWGRWGPGDELGTVNHITEEARRQATIAISHGRVFSLSIAYEAAGPQPAGDRRLNPHHAMLQTGTDLRAGVQPNSIEGWGYADDMVTMALQCATHWDALSHAFYGYRMYNDRDCCLVDINGARQNSIVPVSPRIVTRGLLVDLPRALGVDHLALDHHVTVEELETVLERQRAVVRPGDILLLRTGNLARARRGGGWDAYTYTDEPGLGLAELPWLHERQVAGWPPTPGRWR
jgi:hypothetical protein